LRRGRSGRRDSRLGVGGEGSPQQREEQLREVHDFLVRQGVAEEEIDRADRDDVIDLLVADHLVLPSRARYTEAEVAVATGVPVELARQFWRALGFPDPKPEDRTFTDMDIEAIRSLESMMELGVGDVDTFLQLARVVGSSMARIAEAEVSPSMLGLLAAPGSSDGVAAAHRFARIADQILPATGRLLEFVWRRHVQAAVRRAMTLRLRGMGNLPRLSVGFADMVGFTMLSQQLSEDELAAVVSRFDDVAHDVVTSLGGRVVKMIGDEAMFVTESTVAAAEIGLALAERYADDDMLSDVRVALAVGPVLAQDGDYYGPVVNLANRVVDVAAPGSVLVSDEFHSALLEDVAGYDGTGDAAKQADGSARAATGREGAHARGFVFKPLRPRTVKDVGRVQLWALYRPGDEVQGLDRRRRRWERLSEVLRDLDELRERGEKLISSGLRAATYLEHPPSGVGDPEGGDPEGP
jgi:adenylate cyclase